MFRKIRIAALSALLGLGTLAAPATARADGIYFSFGHKGPSAGVYIGKERYHRPRRHHRWHGRHVCTPRFALHKAERMGLRHARVTRVNRNIIRISGRKHYRHAHIVFARAPHCPVIRVR